MAFYAFINLYLEKEKLKIGNRHFVSTGLGKLSIIFSQGPIKLTIIDFITGQFVYRIFLSKIR